MKNANHFLNKIVFYCVVLSIGGIVVLSYNRFVVKNDYLVSYKVTCDPAIASCFVGCENEKCTEQYYYSLVEKYAPDLYSECGLDITNCEEANFCTTNDSQCSITYCNPNLRGNTCHGPTGKKEPLSNESTI